MQSTSSQSAAFGMAATGLYRLRLGARPITDDIEFLPALIGCARPSLADLVR